MSKKIRRMFSDTKRLSCSEESGTASYRVDPGASPIHSKAASILDTAPYKRMTYRGALACSLSYIIVWSGGNRECGKRLERLAPLVGRPSARAGLLICA